MLLLSGMRLLSGTWTIGIDILYWWLGGVIGFLFVFCDRLIYELVTNPGRTMNTKIKQLFGEGRLVRGMVAILGEREREDRLMMRSVLFLAIWVVLAFWVVSSVSSMFARGLVMGLGTHLVFDLLWEYSKNKEGINDWFWQIKRVVNENEKRMVVLTASMVYLWLIWWL